jgi:adenylate cyclase
MESLQTVVFRFADAEFEQLSGTLRTGGQVRRLRPQTAAVLTQLLEHAGQLVTHDKLIHSVWGDTIVTDNSLAQCISEIRSALGPDKASVIESVPRRGYVVRVPVAHAVSGVPLAEPVAAAIPADVANSVPAPVGGLVGGAPATGRRSARWAMVWLASTLVLAGALWFAWYHNTKSKADGALTLAVLPLEIKANDADLAWFGDVVGEDLTYNLSRIPGTRVISRVSTQAYPANGVDVRAVGQQLGVLYLVGGSLRREGDKILLNLHMADTHTGQQHWAERFTTSIAGLPATEHWAAQRIAQSLHLQLINTFAHQTEQLSAQQLDAHTLGLQAWAAWNLDTPKDAERAKALALQSLAIDERSILALKTMSSWHLRARINQSMPAEEALSGAESYARRAMAVDPNHPLVNTVMGGALTLRGQYEASIRHLTEEIQSNPSHPVAYYFLGLAYLMQGEPQRATKTYEQLISISPRDTRLSRYYRNLAVAYLHQGQMKPALQFARAATETPQVFPNAWAALASVCALSGEPACSQSAMQKFTALRPGFDIQRVEAEWPPASAGFTTQHAEFLRGLRLAGLPEKGQPPPPRQP